LPPRAKRAKRWYLEGWWKGKICLEHGASARRQSRRGCAASTASPARLQHGEQTKCFFQIGSETGLEISQAWYRDLHATLERDGRIGFSYASSFHQQE